MLAANSDYIVNYTVSDLHQCILLDNLMEKLQQRAIDRWCMHCVRIEPVVLTEQAFYAAKFDDERGELLS